MKCAHFFYSILFVLCFAGCATTIPLDVVKPPTLDTSGINRIVIEAFGISNGLYSNGRQVAQDLTNRITEVVLQTGKFTIVDSSEYSRIKRSGENLANFFDALLTGEITDYAVNNTTRQAEKTNENGSTYKVTEYNREVKLTFIYRLIRSRDGSVIGQITKSGTTGGFWGGWVDKSSDLTPPRDMAKTIINDLSKQIVRDIVPWTIIEKRTLEEDKSKNPLMKDALKRVKEKNYRSALNIYNMVYEDTDNFAAGFNAAILTEVLGDLNGAINIMQRLEAEIGNPKSTVELARMKQSLAESQILTEKYDESKLGGPILNAVERIVNDLSARLPVKSTISILNVSISEKQLVEYVIEMIMTGVINEGQLTIVERQNLQSIQIEQAFQMSGNVSDETAVSIGNMLGAKIVITCSIAGSSSLRHLLVKALNVETGEIIYQID
jgi:curli biogenesis system outer membrane secretion channel CsgG